MIIRFEFEDEDVLKSHEPSWLKTRKKNGTMHYPYIWTEKGSLEDPDTLNMT